MSELEFVELTGDELAWFLHQFAYVPGNPIKTVRIMVDGGVKVKVNEDMWSVPLGRVVDVEL